MKKIGINEKNAKKQKQKNLFIRGTRSKQPHGNDLILPASNLTNVLKLSGWS